MMTPDIAALLISISLLNQQHKFLEWQNSPQCYTSQKLQAITENPFCIHHCISLELATQISWGQQETRILYIMKMTRTHYLNKHISMDNTMHHRNGYQLLKGPISGNVSNISSSCFQNLQHNFPETSRRPQYYTL